MSKMLAHYTRFESSAQTIGVGMRNIVIKLKLRVSAEELWGSPPNLINLKDQAIQIPLGHMERQRIDVIESFIWQ